MKEFKKDKLTVKVMATRTEMGEVAAQDIHDRILTLLSEKDEINPKVGKYIVRQGGMSIFVSFP